MPVEEVKPLQTWTREELLRIREQEGDGKRKDPPAQDREEQ